MPPRESELCRRASAEREFCSLNDFDAMFISHFEGVKGMSCPCLADEFVREYTEVCFLSLTLLSIAKVDILHWQA